MVAALMLAKSDGSYSLIVNLALIRGCASSSKRVTIPGTTYQLHSRAASKDDLPPTEVRGTAFESAPKLGMAVGVGLDDGPIGQDNLYRHQRKLCKLVVLTWTFATVTYLTALDTIWSNTIQAGESRIAACNSVVSYDTGTTKHRACS